MTLIRNQRPDPPFGPDPTPVPPFQPVHRIKPIRADRRCAGVRIAGERENPIAMDDMMAASGKGFGNRGLPAARKSFDQEVSLSQSLPLFR